MISDIQMRVSEDDREYIWRLRQTLRVPVILQNTRWFVRNRSWFGRHQRCINLKRLPSRHSHIPLFSHFIIMYFYLKRKFNKKNLGSWAITGRNRNAANLMEKSLLVLHFPLRAPKSQNLKGMWLVRVSLTSNPIICYHTGHEEHCPRSQVNDQAAD